MISRLRILSKIIPKSVFSLIKAFTLLPFLFISKPKLANCFIFAKNTDLKRNILEKRYVAIQYPANPHIEDRYSVQQLKNLEGYMINVFDGHGGWQVGILF